MTKRQSDRKNPSADASTGLGEAESTGDGDNGARPTGRAERSDVTSNREETDGNADDSKYDECGGNDDGYVRAGDGAVGPDCAATPSSPPRPPPPPPRLVATTSPLPLPRHGQAFMKARAEYIRAAAGQQRSHAGVAGWQLNL